MNKVINLSSENVSDIKYDSIIAITIAEGSAMGEPNGVNIVLNDMSHYHFNLGYTDIDIKKFFDDNPVFNSIKCSIGGIVEIDKDWKWFYMGFGNYLIVRKEYYEKYSCILKEKIGDKYSSGELYNNWYKILDETLMSK